MTGWQPGATPGMLRERACLNAEIRAFFADRGVLEVETPLLYGSTASDAHLASYTTIEPGSEGNVPSVSGSLNRPRARQLFLQTSPEFAMKRLLAAGSGPIYQLGKAFRAGDAGERHNPEFTMLEWYRPGFSLEQLMDEVDALLAQALAGTAYPGGFPYASADRVQYRALFESRFSCNPHSADVSVLRDLVVRETSFGDAALLDAVVCLDLLFSVCIEPSLGHERPVFVFDFPAAQASLAQVRVNADGDRVAARCEVYVRGMELANAYLELTDAAEQRRRFEADNALRLAVGLPAIPPDEHLLAALASGLPPCAGIALGVDRLLMLRTGASNLDALLAFSVARI